MYNLKSSVFCTILTYFFSGILAQKGEIERFDHKVWFLRTFPYLAGTEPTDFVGIHMSGVKTGKRRFYWNKFFGTDSSQIQESKTIDLKPSKGQIELEMHISNGNATTIKTPN